MTTSTTSRPPPLRRPPPLPEGHDEPVSDAQGRRRLSRRRPDPHPHRRHRDRLARLTEPSPDLGPVQTGATASFPTLAAAGLDGPNADPDDAILDATSVDDIDLGHANIDDELEASGEWEQAIAAAQAGAVQPVEPEPEPEPDAREPDAPEPDVDAPETSGEWEQAIAAARGDATETSGEWERAIEAARAGEPVVEEDAAVPVQTGDTATHPIVRGDPKPDPASDDLEDVDLDAAAPDEHNDGDGFDSEFDL